MSVSISFFRSRRLLPGIAFLVAFFFLTGQFFNCCLINKSFGAALAHVFHPSSHDDRAQAHADLDGDEHADCHGHGHGNAGQAHPETIANPGPTAEAGPFFERAEHCLSEQSFRGKPMLASEIAGAHVPVSVVHVLAEVPAPLLFLFERPRPQNKSSPPLYLTTLRLLV